MRPFFFSPPTPPTRPTQRTNKPTVDGGERAVVYDRFRGVLPDVTGEGTHFRVPWVQTMHVMDIRTRPRSISSVTGTKGEWGGCFGLYIVVV